MSHVGLSLLSPSIGRSVVAKVTLDQRIQADALLDSGATANFLDVKFCTTNKINLRKNAESVQVSLANGSILPQIKFVTAPIEFRIGDHLEQIVFYVGSFPKTPIILGMPWLERHNPSIDWRNRIITFFPNTCPNSCNLREHTKIKTFHARSVTDSSSSSSSTLTPVISNIPQQYVDFKDVFSKRKANILPEQRSYDCEIDLINDKPFPTQRSIYKLTVTEQQTLREYIEENRKKGFIRNSKSPFGAPIFFVKKKDGSLRPCVDYRGLNSITVKNRHPLPLLDSFFTTLAGAKVFTKIDLRGAYNLVRIKPGDEWKTAFRCQFGHFEYLVMPFGLSNAPAVFQSMMTDIFRDCLDRFVFIYLDDILIFSKDIDSHKLHVREVLRILQRHQLFAKLEKCVFEVSSVEFLGFNITDQGFSMCTDKTSAIESWPKPSSVRELQQFLGFTNFYRRFIKNYSSLAKPLTDLTSKKRTYCWSTAADQAFKTLKEKLLDKSAILRHPQPNLPFQLHTDASDFAIGAILSQDGHPIDYFSKKLLPAEANYAIHDKELLAIIAALRHWRHLLVGTQFPTQIFTDHKNLTFFRTKQILKQRHARWAEFLSEFEYELHHIPGNQNTPADAISRRPDLQSQEPYTGALLPPKRWVHANVIQVTDSQERTDIMLSRHVDRQAGHGGFRKTLDLISRDFSWPGMRKDIKSFVKTCQICQQCKSSRQVALGKLNPLPIPSQPWKSVSLDFIVKLPVSLGYDSILVVVDRLSKMAHFIPCQESISAAYTAKLYLLHVFRFHGLPDDIISDRGPQFRSGFWKTLWQQFAVSPKLSSAFHPQTDGQTERTNQTLEQYLRCYANDRQDNWAQLLQFAEFAYNNSVHSATQVTPFYLLYGFHPRADYLTPPRHGNVPAAKERAELMNQHLDVARTHLAEAQLAAQRFANRRRRQHSFKIGDLVWLSTKNLNLGGTRKLTPLFIGPFKLSEQINEVAFRLDLPNHFKIHSVFHCSLLSPYHGNSSTIQSPTAVVLNDEQPPVDSILQSRYRNNQLEYLVKWENQSEDENAWVLQSEIPQASSLINEFLAKNPLPTEQSNYVGEKIIDSRSANGNTEFLVKWKNFPIDDSSWLPLDQVKNSYMYSRYLKEQNPTPRSRRRGRRLLEGG